MPILHRHVVPNVPALTAGNDAIVFRNGAPSHQRKMKFSLAWGGDLGIAEWIAQDHPSIVGWRDPTMSADDMNDFLARADFTKADDEYFYNGPDEKILNDSVEFAPAYFRRENLDSHYEFANGANVTKDVAAFELWAGLEWEAANQDWKWVAKLYQLTLGFYWDDPPYASQRAGCLFRFRADGSSYALYESAATTQKLRAGNGVVMNFAGVHNPNARSQWAADVLAGTYLTISAQYA